MTSPFRILCAVDASLPPAAAFEQALAMSVQRGAQLVVVHAVENTSYSWGADRPRSLPIRVHRGSSRKGSHLPGTARSSRHRTSHAFLPSGRVCG